MIGDNTKRGHEKCSDSHKLQACRVTLGETKPFLHVVTSPASLKESSSSTKIAVQACYLYIYPHDELESENNRHRPDRLVLLQLEVRRRVFLSNSTEMG